jgi:predicted transcriptional regulator
LASVSATRDWRNIVISALNNSNFYPHILRGFFAGEGSVKFGSHNNRTLLVAQKQPKIFINKILHNLGISHTFSINNRSYVITGKWNWDIFAKYRLADLHPIKREKFWKIYKEFKEEHYPALQLKNQVLEKLKKPLTACELADIFNRSQARICDVLMELKKENKIKNFRIGSKDYWTNQNIAIVSKIKAKYLQLLTEGFTKTSEFAKKLAVDWKSANRRLKELEKLRLVRFDVNGWRAIAKTNVVVI